MAEVRELIEKFRGGDRGGIEEIITMMTLMQGQLDPNSFLIGMLLGKGGGRGLDRSVALMLAMSTANQANLNAQQSGTGCPTTNPMQQILPLLLLLGKDDWDSDRSIEVVEKKAQRG